MSLSEKIVGEPKCEVVVYEDNKLKTITAKKNTKAVLDEDQYVEEIEKIIERDFFPDLIKIRAQTEYQEAVENNDVTKIRFLQNKFRIRSELNKPGGGLGFESEPSTPATFETPVIRSNEEKDQKNEKENSEVGSNQNEDKAKELSLDKFLNKYTSEDNASFDVIQEEAIRKHQNKFPWMYQNELEHEKRIKESLALPSIEKQAIEEEKVAGVLTWKYSNKNTVMYNPEGAALTIQEKLDNIKQVQVAHENTRFKVMPFNEQINQAAIAHAAHIQAKQKEGKIGVDGKELVPKDTPQVNGFKFVPMTPSPMPGVSESPLMTWGMIEGTPFRLDGSDTPLPSNYTPGTSQFKIPELPQREKIAMSLADRVAKKHRDKKQLTNKTFSSTPSPSFGSKTPIEQLSLMSPAAQRLFTKQLGLNKNSDTSLLASYSPARSSGSGALSSTPKKKTISLTPKTSKLGNREKRPAKLTPSLTDNLLNLPKRTKASDYF